jgi:hypothetical protein
MHMHAGRSEQRKMGSSQMHLISYVSSEFKIKLSTQLLRLFVSLGALDRYRFQAKVPG